MTRKHPESLWCRYADDGICHCKTKEQAESLLKELEQRFIDCKLEIHPEKTKIVYCNTRNHREILAEHTSFVFLGYEFRTRGAENKSTKKVFASFLPSISPKAEKSILEKLRELNVRNRSDLSLLQIAKWLNPMIRGWINYYGKYTVSALTYTLQRINGMLVRWSMRKYDSLKNKKTRAVKHMEEFARNNTNLFVHWKAGITNALI